MSLLESIFRDAHQRLRPQRPVPELHVEFFPFAGITHTARFRNDRLFIRVSDLLSDAPKEVLDALALILLAKTYRRQAPAQHHKIYRGFILRHDVQARARAFRSVRGRGPRTVSGKGDWKDLDLNFARINTLYFGGQLERPTLGWSGTRSRRILGRYDSAHRTIVISRVFDSPTVPDFVLDYVLYHEMLHIKHPSRVKDCRMITHSAEFRADEKKFKDYKKATNWIRKI